VREEEEVGNNYKTNKQKKRSDLLGCLATEVYCRGVAFGAGYS